MIKFSPVDENLKTYPPLAIRYESMKSKFDPFVSGQPPLGLQIVARMVDFDIMNRYQLNR